MAGTEVTYWDPGLAQSNTLNYPPGYTTDLVEQWPPTLGVTLASPPIPSPVGFPVKLRIQRIEQTVNASGGALTRTYVAENGYKVLDTFTYGTNQTVPTKVERSTAFARPIISNLALNAAGTTITFRSTGVAITGLSGYLTGTLAGVAFNRTLTFASATSATVSGAAISKDARALEVSISTIPADPSIIGVSVTNNSTI